MPEASAPGKLIIFGEYAVIEGAPAIATAVDVRAGASVSVCEGPDSLLFDALNGQSYPFFVDSGHGLQWRDRSPGARGTILEAVFATLRDRIPARVSSGHRFSIDTDAFYIGMDGSSSKLGLGSSAAAMVALVGAVMDCAGIAATDTERFEICCAAHRTFQGGQGSGIDIATSLTGGVVRIRSVETDAVPEIDDVGWPEGLFMLPVWSGSSASTTELLGRFNHYRESEPAEFRDHLARLKTLAEKADKAWSDRDVTTLLETLAAYDSALRSLDRDGAVGIDTDTHGALRALSARHGAIYKTSGAGGGDFGIALSDSPTVIESLDSALKDRGYLVLNDSLGADGLTIADRTPVETGRLV